MPLTLSASVGVAAPNQPDDVVALQEGLRRAAELTLDSRLDPGPPSGLGGPDTDDAIAAFQTRLGFRRPDGRVDPGGVTLQRLNALLAIGDTEIGFPFEASSAAAYLGPNAGIRAFGTNRSKGRRAHAGIDLYFPDFTPIYAVADGVVTRGSYHFYKRTNAIEIDHGTFVARYAEMAPEKTPPVRTGDRVRRGQQVGRVGVMMDERGRRVTFASSMMLHFEMYDKTRTGPLTVRGSGSGRHTNGLTFSRRPDLLDPTGFMRRAPLRA